MQQLTYSELLVKGMPEAQDLGPIWAMKPDPVSL